MNIADWIRETRPARIARKLVYKLRGLNEDQSQLMVDVDDEIARIRKSLPFQLSQDTAIASAAHSPTEGDDGTGAADHDENDPEGKTDPERPGAKQSPKKRRVKGTGHIPSLSDRAAPRYVRVFSWSLYHDHGVQIEKADGFLSSIVSAAEKRPPPFGFDLLIVEADNIVGVVLLFVAELGRDRAPSVYSPLFFNRIGQWFMETTKILEVENAVLHVVEMPLGKRFPGLHVHRAERVRPDRATA